MNPASTPAKSASPRPSVIIRTADDFSYRRRVLLAIPAAAFGGIFLLLTVALLSRSQEPNTATLERRADTALSSGDHATAKVEYERLLQRDPSNTRYKEGYAIASQSGHRK